MEIQLELPVSFTIGAKTAIENIISTQNLAAHYGLRVGLKGAGCGASYLLGFDTTEKQDIVFEHSPIRIIIDRKHVMHVSGLEIDFEDGSEGAGFTFNRL
jgi:iron-sulfur cluster assembly protein